MSNPPGRNSTAEAPRQSFAYLGSRNASVQSASPSLAGATSVERSQIKKKKSGKKTFRKPGLEFR